jgi:threonine/homoserine/homoserine lactone efflux protein
MELSSFYLHALLNLMMVHLAAAMSPGPSAILVAHASAFNSRKAGLTAAAAMAVGVAV